MAGRKLGKTGAQECSLKPSRAIIAVPFRMGILNVIARPQNEIRSVAAQQVRQVVF